MDNVDMFWEAAGRLTYGEMAQVAAQMRDAADSIGIDKEDAYSWALVIETARINAGEPE